MNRKARVAINATMDDEGRVHIEVLVDGGRGFAARDYKSDPGDPGSEVAIEKAWTNASGDIDVWMSRWMGVTLSDRVRGGFDVEEPSGTCKCGKVKLGPVPPKTPSGEDWATGVMHMKTKDIGAEWHSKALCNLPEAKEPV